MPIDKLAAAAALLPPCPHTRTSDAIRQFIALHAEAQNSPFRMHMPQHISGSVLQSAMVGPRWPL